MLLVLKLEDLSRIKTIFMGQSSFVHVLRRNVICFEAKKTTNWCFGKSELSSFILEWDECRDGTQIEVLTNENITTARTYTGV